MEKDIICADTHAHIHAQPLIHTGMNTRIHSNTHKCSAITVNMHKLINIFAQLQWLSSPPSGLLFPPSSLFPSSFTSWAVFSSSNYNLFSFHFVTVGSPALPKGPLHYPLSTNLRRLQYDWVESYVHEVQPCTQWAGQDWPSQCGLQLSVSI